MFEMATRKIKPHHLEREACLYVRQSSLRQVARNTESARRQYGLSRNAMALGWPAERIRVIDDDQGKSGSYSENRSGFRDLMARIGAGEVGIVLVLEVSRLARDNADWHQLLRLASITDTLILDQADVYDPNDGNDRLLLGFKGTISEFELQEIRARMVGGQRSAARRGALKLSLPIGLAYNEHDEVVFDSDRSVVDAIGLVFETFRRKGSAMAVVKWMHQQNIALPSRPSCGPCRGQVRWNLPSGGQVVYILKNPRYAGTYAYGKTTSERRIDGTARRRLVPMEQWQVCIPEAHAGFIDWHEYCRNQATMASNAKAYAPWDRRIAAPREGAALLQARVICGRCGSRMSPFYSQARPSRSERSHSYYRCRKQHDRCGKNICQSIRAEAVDCEISRFVIASMNRENINLALSVQDQIRTEFAAADAQRANRIEALRYEVNLAQRRFFEVDPANRLVAATLEADWNERLLNLEQACREREAHTTARDAEISDQQVLRIQELTQDFERVWNAPETKNTDRKRLLGLLIEDATLTRDGYEVSIELRMRGGKTLTLDSVSLPKPVALLKKTRPETLAALDRLLDTHTAKGAARELNRNGHRNWKGELYSTTRVQSMRRDYGLRSHVERMQERLREQGYATAAEMAEQFGVSVYTIRRWARKNCRMERKVILTEGREYCMYRIHCDSEPIHSNCNTAKGCNADTEKNAHAPQTEQGVL